VLQPWLLLRLLRACDAVILRLRGCWRPAVRSLLLQGG
jgi:hypothetical protein